MAPFAFPPPPPPPSKPSPCEKPVVRSAQWRGGNSGRGDRGQCRGRVQNRRGGNPNSYENVRGRQEPRYNNTWNACHKDRPREGFNDGNRQYQYQPYPQPTSSSSMRTHVDPTLASQSPLADRNFLAQATSFVATPAGQPSVNAFANYITSEGAFGKPIPQYSTSQHVGQKRKMYDSNAEKQRPRPSTQSSKPPRAKTAVAPAVPSFGFSLPNLSPACSQTMGGVKDNKDRKKAKPQLGLVSCPLPDQSSETESVDEEAEYMTKLTSGGFAFEHQGEQISLQTAADIAAWIKDRRKNFPTHKRILDKAEENAMRRNTELSFLRKVQGKTVQTVNEIKPNEFTQMHDKSDHAKEKKRDDEKRQELAALRKKLYESMAQRRVMPAVSNLGVGYESDTESDDESSVLSASSFVSSSDESASESSCESEDEKAPELVSSKIEPLPLKIPPSILSPAPPLTKTEHQVCRSWERYGRCSYSHKCKFSHPPKETRRQGLYEVMVEQELLQRDKAMLDAIKYLGQHGFLG